MGAPDFSRRSLADKFLYRALVRVNSVPNFNFLATSYGHMEGVPKWKGGAADLFRRPLADKFLHLAIVRANAYNSIPNFKFLSLIVSEMKRVSQNLMWGLLVPCRTSYAETFMYAESTWQGETARQISASYLYASFSYANMYFP